MKKISIAIVSLALMVGVACGGKSGWSEADKAKLDQGLGMAVAMKALNQDQADCMSDWLQDRFDSFEAATAAESDRAAQKDLMSKCDLDPEYFGNEEEIEVEVEPSTTTTTAVKNIDCKDEVEKIGIRLENASSVIQYGLYDSYDEMLDRVNVSLESVEFCANETPEIVQYRSRLMEAKDKLS